VVLKINSNQNFKLIFHYISLHVW